MISATECAALGCCFALPADTPGTRIDVKAWNCYHPASIASLNLNGSTDVFDCYDGSKTCSKWYAERQSQGLISREGWAVVDDSGGPLLDGSTDS